MPTKTFFNLPKEKRIRILKAGKKEFSRVPLEKAVIANIAKDASIPRGSFYQYFSSLEDLFSYIIDYMYGFNKKKFEESLKANNNNVFDAIKENFSQEIDRLSKEENRQFTINTMTLLLQDSKNYSRDFIENIYDKRNNLDLEFFPEEYQASTNFSKVLDVINMVGDNCISKYLSQEQSAEEVKKDYNNYVDFVKGAFLRI